MSATVPFAPHYGTGQTRTAGASTAYVIDGQDQQVCVTNLDALAIAYFRTGDGDCTAADMIVLPGKAVVVTKGDGVVRIACYSAGAPVLHIMTGNGWLNEA